MEKFTVSFYQGMSYFACGFVVLFCSYFNGSLADLPMSINDFSLAFSTDKSTFAIAFLIIAFIIGYAIHIIRQGVVEWVATELIWIKWIIKKNKKDNELSGEQKKRVKDIEINWDFFHDAPTKEIEKFITSYYTGYGFAWNMIFALIIVCIGFFLKDNREYNTKVIVIILLTILLLSLFIIRIRKQIVKATAKSIRKIDDKDNVNDENCPSISKIETEIIKAKEALKKTKEYIDGILK